MCRRGITQRPRRASTPRSGARAPSVDPTEVDMLALRLLPDFTGRKVGKSWKHANPDHCGNEVQTER